ncbi:hypothetical protein GGX14DRAFT_386277 [Mycena pura]|uniref:CxC2-like cysteine cluster KDZ transposase-associated domain-containing protein n=1 Tax=Mycena pura TaxID=153505 RepID=A0AAD7E2R1_9AGAR|nr:hypothetical protein GGX14DRAFT_386277 [Mycena pura]
MPPRRDPLVYMDETIELTAGDRAIHYSGDGERAVRSFVDLRPAKRLRLHPSELDDEFAEWTPVPDADLDEVDALASTITSYDSELDVGGKVYYIQHDEGGKRKRYKSSEWTGEFWTDAKVHGAEGVTAVYQLGHHGFPCAFPGRRRSMVVLDVRGIFKVDIQYCNCEKAAHCNNLAQLLGNAWYPATTIDPETCATFEVLEMFRLLNVIGNININDFVTTLERLTDPTHLSGTPDRYKAFGRMSRQYNFLKRAKRAGRGHVNNGLQTTGPGELAVACWTCPQDGRNLPHGWRDVKDRYLYTLLLALDANFRLKNRIRANEHDDPSLGSGQGYFVETAAYKEHLRTYVAEKDVSSCVAFAALMQKETRLTTGLRVSGVGGCVCARHGVVRPLGLGDLQKGERYSNMDYVFLSSLEGAGVERLTVSYDIACQWQVHLLERAQHILEKTNINTDVSKYDIQYALPVWHAGAHELDCQVQNSLAYTPGAGKTDGEGIERTWSVLNPVAWATKEMGEGSRHDMVEDKVDHINFGKNISQGHTLARKLIVAIAEGQNQVADFKDLDRTVQKDLKADWRQRIDTWVMDKSKPNPYVVGGSHKSGPGEREVLLELKKAELEDASERRMTLTAGSMSVSAFIKAGLQLEEMQRRIRAEVKGSTLVTADRSSQLQEQRISLVKKVQKFEKLADIFMPGVTALREQEEERRDSELPPPKAEDLKLWLPSNLTDDQRRSACQRSLAEAEAKLRRGQCADAIAQLRTRIHAQLHLIYFRNTNSVGQKGSTRSATLIERIGGRISASAEKYRNARAALTKLKGANYAPEFRELLATDVTSKPPVDRDAEATKRLSRAEISRPSRSEPSVQQLMKNVSWIWMVGGTADAAEMHDSIRVEWSKARARRDRWNEEVALLREEMKRVLRSLHAEQRAWERRIGQRNGLDAELAAGLDAYALRQKAVYRRVGEQFYTGWNKSVAEAVRDVVRRDGKIYRDLLDGVVEETVESEGGLENVEEEEEGRAAPTTTGYNTRAAAAASS